jgi:ABC-type transport system involved in multi-copper enzyme maturation permease subunit
MGAVSWPLVRKELRQNLRAKATLIVENLYLLILVVLAGWQVYGATQGCSPQPMWEYGRSTFWQIAHLQAVLLGLVAAALTAATITAEREQKTEDLLLATPTRVREIVRSKLVALLVIGLVLLLLSVPVSVLCLLLGGLIWQEVGLAYLVTWIWIALAGAIGILTGALVRRTMAAVPLAIVATFLVNGVAASLAEAKLPHAVLAGSGGLSLISNEVSLSFFRLPLPIWVAAVALCLPVAICFLESAVDRVRLPHQRRPIAQRIWLLLSAVIASALALGVVITQPLDPSSPPWDILLAGLAIQGCILLIVAAVFSSQGLGKRDHAALRGERRLLLDALFGSGPRAGARWTMILSVIVLVGWTSVWLIRRHDVGVPVWRVVLATANLLAGIWVACLLGQLAGFWGRLKREWLRRTVGLLFLALIFGVPPAVGGLIWRGQELPSPAVITLLLSNPLTGCVVAFDPVAPMHGSAFAANADRLLPLGLYSLLFLLTVGAMLALILSRVRRVVQLALTQGAAPATRETEASLRANG